MSGGLALAGPNAIVLNGSSIQRASTNPTQAANLTVADGGLLGFSLVAADGSPVLLDCSEAPVVENVKATAFAGTYGAGQRIYFQVLAMEIEIPARAHTRTQISAIADAVFRTLSEHKFGTVFPCT